MMRLTILASRVFLMLVATVVPAFASGPGPNGVNIGFDFNWNSGVGTAVGLNASFVASVSGPNMTLNNNGGPLTPTTNAGAFVFSYSVGGVPQQSMPTGSPYDTWPAPGPARLCNLNPTSSTPLTLFNCFNANSFGELFVATATGPLTSMTMSMTCLNPTGAPPTGLYALLYNVDANGTTISTAPIAQVAVDLSSCPTMTDWEGHTFSAADFASISLNFTGVTLTSGGYYGVFFGGLTPGEQPSGATPVPALPKGGILALVATLLFVGGWQIRRRYIVRKTV